MDGDTPLRRHDERIQNLPSGFIIGEHIEKDAQPRTRRRNQGMHRGQPFVGRVDDVKVVVTDVKQLSRKCWRGGRGLHSTEVVRRPRHGKGRAVFIDILAGKP